ncbi:MAG: metal-dependent transcriptional regulator [Clostridia bacterium]|nr:metal-dependent transcriptional regulator [Clostridia bacterium]
MHIQESGQMYLESIYVLSQTQSVVRAIDVSEYMGFSKPSVSRALGILRKNGFLTTNENGHLQLTEAGLSMAQNIYERHTTLKRLLIAMGVSEQVAAEDACKIEHDISEETFLVIKSYLAKQNM